MRGHGNGGGMSLRWRLLILIMLASGLILCAIILHNADFARRALGRALRDKAAELASHAAVVIDARIRVAARAVEMAAAENGEEYTTRIVGDPVTLQRESAGRLERLLAANSELYGAAIALDPSIPGLESGFSPYLCRPGGGKTMSSSLANEDYNYTARDWYIVPRELDHPAWSEPAYDDGGGEELMVTYSVPFRFPSGNRARDGKADGIQTGDLTLEWLDEVLRSLPLGKEDYAFLVSRFGTVIAHPDTDWEMNETLFSLAARYNEPEAAEWARSVLSTESGIAQIPGLFGSTERAWAAHEPVPSTGWTMVAMLSQDDANKEIRSLVMTEVQIGVLGLILLLISGILITGNITRPLRRLTLATKEMTHGNLDTPLPAPEGGDEIADLTRHFASMRGELKRYMRNLSLAAVARERIESELRIASDIQLSFLPEQVPSIPGVDLAVVFKPAREVGGDLYDVRLDPAGRRLYLVIGDVSGKGVPAALFMAMASSLWRHLTEECVQPADILAGLNRELCKENHSYYFVTMFCVVVHLDTGILQYASAGHPPQAYRRADGECQWLPAAGELNPSLPLGLKADETYRGGSRRMEPGELLLLFTDGVNEAENKNREQLGDEPILKQLENATGDCAETLSGLQRLVENHVAGAEQSDDLTMLAFRYLGNGAGGGGSATMEKVWDPASTYATGIMLDWLADAARNLRLPEDIKDSLGVVLEETLVNAVRHGGAERARVAVTRWESEVETAIRDDGVEFNPLTVPEPDLDLPLEERPVGGLGIVLLRRFTDRQKWRREGGENVLTLWNSLSPAEAEVPAGKERDV